MIISQFRTDPVLINIGKRYRAWHTLNGADGFPSRQIPMGKAGSGREFFQFHRTIMDEFFAWNAVHHAVETKDITAWTAVPSELKVPETGWPTPWSGLDLAVAEIRVHTNVPPFANDDELGIFAENTVLNWIHGAVAAAPAFNLDPAEQRIITGLRSLESTLFYKIYGLADFWWNQLRHPKSNFKEISDFVGSGRGFKEIVDFKAINDFSGSGRGFKEIVDFKEINDFCGSRRGFKEIVDFKEINDFCGSGRGFKKEFKEIVDAHGGQVATPSILTNLLERVRALEARLRIKKSPFIKPYQRPNVGASVVRSKRKKNP